MSRIHVGALVALSAAALLTSPAPAQAQREPTTVRVEQELKISVEMPALPSAQCEAVATSEYQQRKGGVTGGSGCSGASAHMHRKPRTGR